MSYGKWKYIDGKGWIAQDEHTIKFEPDTRGITPGHPPGFKILHGEYKKDNLRKFDKPDDTQIKQLQKEDEQKDKLDIGQIVEESKKDLESGKIKIEEGVLANLNKNKYERVNAFAPIVDDRGITHIMPAHKAQTIEQIYESQKLQLKVDPVTIALNAPTEGNIQSKISQSDFINEGFEAVKGKRNDFKGRVF